MDSEKITINLGAVDLGKVDLLVDEGFYGNRTDFIRTAIRNQLDRHESDTSQSIARKAMALGALYYSRQDLEKQAATGVRLAVSVVGLLAIAQDVPPELARQAIESVTVRGVFRASKAVKDVLADITRLSAGPYRQASGGPSCRGTQNAGSSAWMSWPNGIRYRARR